MTEQNHDAEEMREAVRVREKRQRLWDSEGERSLWKNLSMVGALGWLVVVPMLLGVFIGGWLDGRFGTGVTFTGAFIFIGAGLGGYLVWHRISRET